MKTATYPLRAASARFDALTVPPDVLDANLYCTRCNQTFKPGEFVLLHQPLWPNEEESVPSPSSDDIVLGDIVDEDEKDAMKVDNIKDEEDNDDQPLRIRGGGKSHRPSRGRNKNTSPSTPSRVASRSKTRSASKRYNANIEKTPGLAIRSCDVFH